MLRRKKLNMVRRNREDTRKTLLDQKARQKLLAERRAMKKRLLESKPKRDEEFRKEYAKMIHSEPHISSPRSLIGTATKKKSVLE